jgi:hypothetical protein
MSFIWLLFAHYIGDVAFQPQWQAENKAKYWYVMLCHCMIWTGIICIVLQFLGLFEYWKVVFLVIGHFLMDEWKSHQPHDKTVMTYKKVDNGDNGTILVYDKEVTKSNWWMIYPDQGWHIIQLVIVFLWR